MYHGWVASTTPGWVEHDSLAAIDRIRCLAKNMFIEFAPHSACTNLEFSDIVSGKFVADRGLSVVNFNKWKDANPWLYLTESTWATKRFDEAEWELQNNSSYQYN